MSYEGTLGDVTVRVEGSYVATVEIHRSPDNYFDPLLVESVATAFEQLDTDDSCRAIVLCSEGKHFCAGATLGPDANDSTPSGSHLYEQAVRLFGTRKPVVAAVQGAAIGGGLGLALAVDFRVGTPKARFSANFARLGFHHGFGLTVTLPAVVGQQHALELLYSGRRVPGEEAYRIGLIDRLVPVSELRAHAHSFAAEIAGSAPLAVASIRQTMRGDLAARVRAATQRERAEQERLRKTRDFIEGVRATAEHRCPDFHGR